MPSVRNIILLSVSVFTLSIVIACLSMLRPPDSGGLAADSYGTRAYGFRGLFETLDELGVEVVRKLPPPTPGLSTDQTLVFLAPHNSLIEVEPAYLLALNDWVDRGGRIVIAPSSAESSSIYFANCKWEYDVEDESNQEPYVDSEDEDTVEASDDSPSEKLIEEQHADDAELEESDADAEDESPENVNIFSALGLECVTIVSWSTLGDSEEDHRERDWRSSPDNPVELFRQQAEYYVENQAAVPQTVRSVAVGAEGSLSQLNELVQSLALPGDEMFDVIAPDDDPTGTLSYVDAEGVEHQLVAQFQRGQGEIVVISDQHLLTNRYLVRADNSVLAAHLLSPSGGPVAFDEFYHGLSVRGNILYLLTRPSYAAMVVGLLLAVCLWTWREAVFLGPPLADASTSRRDIGEYINAMARFFQRGRRSNPFLLLEVRDGVLQQLCQELGLPPRTHDVDVIVATLSRRDPSRAQRVKIAVGEVDDHLKEPQSMNKSKTTELMQGIVACL